MVGMSRLARLLGEKESEMEADRRGRGLNGSS